MTPEVLVESMLATARARVVSFLNDTCSVKGVSAGSPDGFGGTDFTTPTVATGIRCRYEPTRQPQGLATVGGAVSGTIQHDIFLEMADLDLQAIGPFYEIVVDARGDKGELTFTNCRRKDESDEVCLTVMGTLKQ